MQKKMTELEKKSSSTALRPLRRNTEAMPLEIRKCTRKSTCSKSTAIVNTFLEGPVTHPPAFCFAAAALLPSECKASEWGIFPDEFSPFPMHRLPLFSISTSLYLDPLLLHHVRLQCKARRGPSRDHEGPGELGLRT